MFFQILSLTKPNSPKGFTLYKFVILLSIFILLALMFFPSYMNARFGEIENGAKGNLRIFYEAAELYYKISHPAEYPANLEALTLTDPPLLDLKLMTSAKRNYNYVYVKAGGDKFYILAQPLHKFLTGYHGFYIDQTGIIRLNNAKGEPIDG